MAPPAWAFQLENFEQPPHEELICSICQLVFCDPVECPCNHVFCNQCIKTWIQMHRSCPICRERTPAIALRPVNRIIKNLINGLKLQCKNISLGCDSKVTIETCEAHMKNCLFETEDCPNKCGKSMYRKDLLKHKQEDCLYRECKSCGLKKQLGSPEHDCVVAMKTALDRLRNENSELKEKIKKLETDLDQAKQSNTQSLNRGDRSGSTFDWTTRLFPYFTRLDDSASFTFNLDDEDINDDEEEFNALSFLTETSSSSSTSESLSLEDFDQSAPDDFWRLDPLENSSTIDNSPVVIPAIGSSEAQAEPLPTREARYHSRASAEADSGPNAENTRRSVKRRIPTRSSLSSDSSDDANDNNQRKSQRSSSEDTDMDIEDTLLALYSTSTLSSRPSKRSVRSKSAANVMSSEAACGVSSELVATCSRMPPTRSSLDVRAPQVVKTQIFGRTLALLQPYNSDSDPEWVPNSGSTTSDSEVEPTNDSTSSSSSEEGDNENPSISSESSYEVEVPTPTFDLLQRYSTVISDDSDPDWTPIH